MVRQHRSGDGRVPPPFLLLGVSTDSKYPNVARHDKARPWFCYRDW